MDQPSHGRTTPSVLELDRWSSGGHAPVSRLGSDVLTAEHDLIRAVLDAIEAECVGLKARRPLRIPFWADVIDFVGNFVQGYHRNKEERVLFPALAASGQLDQAQRAGLRHEHGEAHVLTGDLLEGAEAGDWEAVLMIGVRFVHFLRAHLSAEDHLVEGMSEVVLSDQAQDMLADIEAVLARAGGRQHVVEVANRLCAMAGVTAL